MKPSISDVLIFIGLVLIGIGLFFWLGRGVALSVSGALVLLIGVAGNISESRKIIK